jgi:hypothetical protein
MMLTGAALAASEIAMADGRLFWRVSGPGGESCKVLAPGHGFNSERQTERG